MLAEVTSVRGHKIRRTLRQSLPMAENHDDTAGTQALVLATGADPDERVAGEAGVSLALQAYPRSSERGVSPIGPSRDGSRSMTNIWKT